MRATTASPPCMGTGAGCLASSAAAGDADKEPRPARRKEKACSYPVA